MLGNSMKNPFQITANDFSYFTSLMRHSGAVRLRLAYGEQCTDDSETTPCVMSLL